NRLSPQSNILSSWICAQPQRRSADNDIRDSISKDYRGNIRNKSYCYTRIRKAPVPQRTRQRLLLACNRQSRRDYSFSPQGKLEEKTKGRNSKIRRAFSY